MSLFSTLSSLFFKEEKTVTLNFHEGPYVGRYSASLTKVPGLEQPMVTKGFSAKDGTNFFKETYEDGSEVCYVYDRKSDCYDGYYQEIKDAKTIFSPVFGKEKPVATESYSIERSYSTYTKETYKDGTEVCSQKTIDSETFTQAYRNNEGVDFIPISEDGKLDGLVPNYVTKHIPCYDFENPYKFAEIERITPAGECSIESEL